MFDVIRSIIDYVPEIPSEWYTSGSYEPLIYTICGALIVVLTVCFLDAIFRIFKNIFRF